MKLNQKQLRKLIEGIVNEVGPNRFRVDKTLGHELNAEESGEFALNLAQKIRGDKTLKIEKQVLNYVAKKMQSAGVGGANMPSVSAAELGEALIDSPAFQEFESNLVNAINEFIMSITTDATDMYANAGPEQDELASDEVEPDYSRGTGPDRYPRNGGF